MSDNNNEQTTKKSNDWTLPAGVVSTITGKVKEAVTESITELKKLDTMITEISQTSDFTTRQLETMLETSFDLASKYGKSAADYLTGVQEMYRAGFKNAEEMAELSLLTQAAGNLEADAANKYLLAADAAYDLKGNVEELNKVLDSQNYISNSASIRMQDMADATAEAASIASKYGVEMKELSALIAVAVSETGKSGSEVGEALNTFFANLQDTASEPVREALEAVNISMTEMVHGSEQLKTPIALLTELSDAFHTLPEGNNNKEQLLNVIGEENYADTLAAVLTNMDSYHSMLDLYSQGIGSAGKTAAENVNNLQGALNELSNTWTDIVDNILDSETLKGGIDFFNETLTTIDKLTESLGGLGTVFTTLGGYLGSKNLG